MNIVYSVVVGPKDDTERLDAYLYAHTTRVAEASTAEATAWLLRTQSDGDIANAKWLADYQMARLESGMFVRKASGESLTYAANALKNFVVNFAAYAGQKVLDAAEADAEFFTVSAPSIRNGFVIESVPTDVHIDVLEET